MEREEYQARLSKLKIIGAPFFIALLLGLQAYFSGPTPISFLNNGDNALIVLLIGAVGTVIELIVVIYLVTKINSAKL